MEYEVVKLEEKKVAGLTARTNNASPDMGMVIGGLWNRFYQEGIYEGIPDKVDGKALGIYSDYEGDASGDYNITVACAVNSCEKLSEDVVSFTIPAGKYARFVIHGDMVEAVGKAWQEIWQMDLDRAYTFDFEEYQDDSMDNAKIHIYIALRA